MENTVSSVLKQKNLNVISDFILVQKKELKLVHLIIRKLFSQKIDQKLLPAGRLKHFVQNWEKVTGDPEILSLITA